MTKLKAEVRPSDIHGRGVFTLVDIAPGEAICSYEGWISDHVPSDPTYSFSLDDGKYINGWSEPRSTYGIGQLVNDAADVSEILQLNKVTDVEQFVKDNPQYSDEYLFNIIIKYERDSHNNANSILIGHKYPFIMAADNIPAETELLTCYGVDYWFTGPIFRNQLIIYNYIMDSILK